MLKILINSFILIGLLLTGVEGQAKIPVRSVPKISPNKTLRAGMKMGSRVSVPTVVRIPTGVTNNVGSLPIPPSIQLPETTIPQVPSSSLDEMEVKRKQLYPGPLSLDPTVENLRVNVPQNGNKVAFPGRDRIDAVIFDLDGTLVDSLPAWEHVAARYLKTKGIELSPNIEKYLKQIPLRDGAQYLKATLNLPEPVEEILKHTLGIVREHYATDVMLKPGVRETLEKLFQQGIKMCVATASHRELADLVLSRFGVRSYFNFIITCDEVGKGKQEPRVYETAQMILKTAKERTLVVEDAPYAIKTAKKAGFLTAGVADPSYTSEQEEEIANTADYFFTSLAEESLK